MGTISSGVGLVSGIDTASIIDQLLAIEARPQRLISQHNTILTTQQIAFQDINAKLLNLKLSATSLADDSVFNSTTSNSSDTAVISVSSSSTAVPGTYSFLVDRLVGTQQFITSGFADDSTTPLAPAGATLTFEFGEARLDNDVALSELNGGTGVQRGKILVKDRSGSSAEVDLSRALTINDVVDAINNTSGVSVTASVDGDSLKLVDTSGSTTTTLSVTDVGGRTTATELGLTAAAVGDTLTGDVINNVGVNTSLSLLNDGNGVRIASGTGVDDFEVTRRDGSTFRVDLTGSTDLGDVIDAINTADAGVGVTASINAAGTGLDLVDATVGGTTFQVAGVSGSQAALDLGIEQTDGDADGTINGTRVVATLNSKLLSNLNGGSGVTVGQIDITNRVGTLTSVDLSSAVSVDDVIGLINDSGAGVTASLNVAGNGLLITDDTGSTASDLIISDVTGTAAADLGLAGTFTEDQVDSGNLQLQYISEATLLSALNGGKGITKGNFIITDSDGDSATVDLSAGDEITIADVLQDINSRGLDINARINDNGDGIVIEDTGSGLLAIKVEESGSSTARDLGLFGEATAAGSDLVGSFEKTITIEATDTLEDVVNSINNAGINVSATIINDGSTVNPFRLSLLSEKAGRAGAFVFDDGGLGLGTITLTEAQDSLVFYGASDPADAIAITSTTNTLGAVVPGATIDLIGTSSSAVQVTINQDDTKVLDAVSSFVNNFNTVTDTIENVDSYDVETESRGILLGDATVARVRSAIFRHINRRNNDIDGQFTTLGSIGITVKSGTELAFDQAKFLKALSTDPEAVKQLFNLDETDTSLTKEEAEGLTFAKGTFVKIEELLDGLTDSVDGVIQTRIDSLADQIELGNDRISQIDDLLADKRARLEFDFFQMELAIARLQNQSNALASLSAISFSSSSSR